MNNEILGRMLVLM